MSKILILLIGVLLLEPCVWADESLNLAVLPTTKFGLSPWWAPKNYWKDRIERQLRTIEKSKGVFDLVLIGDSITHNWEGWPEDQWRQILAANPRAKRDLLAGNSPGACALARLQREFSVLNLGIGGDTTGDVIWRLRYGKQLKGYRAKCFCLMIGTNNRESPQAVAEGIGEILREIRGQQPWSVVLLLPIFPRGDLPDDKKRLRNEAVNKIIRGFADGKRVVWLDFNKRLSREDGTVSREMMPDLLHPGPAGYEIWADEILPYLRTDWSADLGTGDPNCR